MSTKIKLNGDWVDVANNSVSDSVRNPDWSRKIQVSFAQLYAGYTCPEDGFFYGSIANGDSPIFLQINNSSVSVNNPNQYADVFIPVCAGDIAKSTVQGTAGFAIFVPYRVQKSTEESHAIINIAGDVSEGAILPKSSTTTPLQLAHWTLPKKGIYLIQAVVTLALNQATGISVIQPQYSINADNNSTININMTINATTDNYVVPIKARCYADIDATIGGINISGQAIKLY